MKKAKISKTEKVAYLLLFLMLFVGGLLLMAGDNINWITASPEWNTAHTVCNKLDCWTGAVQDYNFTEKVDYVIKYRVYTVFTHPRDLISVVIMSFLATSLIIFFREIIFKGKLIRKLSK